MYIKYQFVIKRSPKNLILNVLMDKLLDKLKKKNIDANLLDK